MDIYVKANKIVVDEKLFLIRGLNLQVVSIFCDQMTIIWRIAFNWRAERLIRRSEITNTLTAPRSINIGQSPNFYSAIYICMYKHKECVSSWLTEQTPIKQVYAGGFVPINY